MSKNSFVTIFSFIRKWWLLFAVLVFAVYQTFFDENNILKRVGYNREIEYLKSEIERYKKQIEQDSLQIEALKTDKQAVEKYAREKYGYKSPNEDIYIIKNKTDEKN